MANTYTNSKGVTLPKTANVLPDLNAMAKMQAQIEALQAALIEAQSKPAVQAVRCTMGPKGGMCVWGFGRHPYTFYRSQFETFDANYDMIKSWFEANKHKMATKD